MQKFSIINPSGNHQRNDKINNPLLSRVFSELRINRILHMTPIYTGGRITSPNVMDYFTADIETIRHRLDIFEDLLKCDGIIELFKDIVIPAIRDILLQTDSLDSGEFYFISQFHTVNRLKTYISCIQNLHEAFAKLTFESKGLRNFSEKIATIYNSDEFNNLISNLSKMSEHLKKTIKSVTVGINLNKDMSIGDIGIVSINEKRYKAGSVLDKILKADLSPKDQYSLLTPVESVHKGLDLSGAEKHQLDRNFKNALNTLLKGATKKIPNEIASYMKHQIQFLQNLTSEICFLVAGHEMLTGLKNRRVPICKPAISQTNNTYIKNLYHPSLLETIKLDDLVNNSVSFDENGMIYILTGANSGGKSVFLHSVGVAQVLFQLGLYVPASEACMLPVDHLCIHLPTDASIHNSSGRLEQECIAMNEISSIVTSQSLVLIDEIFSSTSVHDGSILLEMLIKHFSRIGCKGLFSTHIHGLPVDRINKDEKADVKVDTLVAITEEGKRTYKISRQKPEGLSHAMDIAKKYGLLVDM